jgi:hypothetical protein
MNCAPRSALNREQPRQQQASAVVGARQPAPSPCSPRNCRGQGSRPVVITASNPAGTGSRKLTLALEA